MNFEKMKTPNGFLETVCSLTAEQQNGFFENLKKTLSPEDVKSVQIAVSLYSIFTNKEKYDAMKNAVGEKLVEEFKPTF